jgi:acyl carrier protein
MREITETDFVSLFEEITETKDSSYAMETVLFEQAVWDSLAILMFISAIDDRFAVVLDPDRIGQCKTLGDLRQLVMTAD